MSGLRSAIDFADRTAPLPRCEHGNALRDGGGEALEPPCGCQENAGSRPYRTSTGGRNYVLHIARGERTWCGRIAAIVNCAGSDTAKLQEDGSDQLCRTCDRRSRASTGDAA